LNHSFCRKNTFFRFFKFIISIFVGSFSTHFLVLKTMISYIKVLIICVLCLSCNVSVFAQNPRPKVQNLRKYDKDNFHLGYTVGFNSGDFSIRNSDIFWNEDFQIYSIEAHQNVGFQFGAISNVHLGENFDLRLLLYASFNQRDLDYTILKKIEGQDPAFINYTMPISSTFMELPLSIKYKSTRVNNYRVYVLGGINPKIDPVHILKKEYIQPNKPQIRLKPYDLLAEVGIGLDIYTTYFKFSPEIKYGVGVLDIMQQDNTMYTTSAAYMKSRMFMLSFHFE